MLEQIQEAVEFIKKQIPNTPQVGLILGPAWETMQILFQTRSLFLMRTSRISCKRRSLVIKAALFFRKSKGCQSLSCKDASIITKDIVWSK